MKKNYAWICWIILLCVSCSDKLSEEVVQPVTNLSTKSIIAEPMEWEGVDYLPTPSGQKIATPWAPTAGSLLGTYDAKVLSDHKKSDGWVLIYNSFTRSGRTKLENPYFALYNTYRGIIRIYMYINSNFVTTSKNISDMVSIDYSLTDYKPTIFNFLGKPFAPNPDDDKLSRPYHKILSNDSYYQIQPSSSDISPFNSNRWYMCEYELAYDPRAFEENIILKWNLNFINVTNYNFNGTMVGSITGTIGSSATNKNPILEGLKGAPSALGYGSFGFLTSNLASQINKNTGENKIGIEKSLAKDIFKGFSDVSGGKYQNYIKGIANMILGSAGGSTPIRLSIHANLTLNGTGTNQGSFPSMPLSFWLPSKNISSLIGEIPLYNKPLGIVNIKSTPEYQAGNHCYYSAESFDLIPYWQEAVFPAKKDNSHRLQFNPELLKIADVRILKEDLVHITLDTGEVVDVEDRKSTGSLFYEEEFHLAMAYEDDLYKRDPHAVEASPYDGLELLPRLFCSRFFIEVTPKNNPKNKIILIKTFEAKYDGKPLE